MLCVLLAVWPVLAADLHAPVPPHKPLVQQDQAAAPYPPAKPVKAAFQAQSAAPDQDPEVSLLNEKDYTNYNLNRALSSADVILYKKIFSVQDRGDFRSADVMVKKLSDTRLLGHALRQRYMHKGYKTTYAELQSWLKHYADHPGADDVYNLAKRKGPLPRDSGVLNQPIKAREIAAVREPTIRWARAYKSTKERNQDEHKQLFAFKRVIHKRIESGDLSGAASLLKSDKRAALMDGVERDIILSEMANAYYYRGDVPRAYALAKEALGRSKVKVPLAAWVAGLAAWREGQYESAAAYFETAGKSPYASGWTAAAGSFWAARSHMKAGNIKNVSEWLERAREHPRTFYGLLATRALGKSFEFNWTLPRLARAPEAVLSVTPAGARAIALVQVGQHELAQEELLRLNIAENEELAQALLVYSQHARLPKLSVRVGNVVSDDDKGYFDAALYPAGPWKPRSGYALDPALIYAVLRQESHFNPNAKSPSGAQGLMQLMPATAKGMGLEADQDLMDPSVNLDIAQSYIEHLFGSELVKGDIVRMLAAYNAGPGNLSKWLKQMGKVDDPLLFIESIPVAETRAYVERVLSNYWIYQRRQGLDTPSLTELAQGKWASYAEMQKIQPYETASN